MTLSSRGPKRGGERGAITVVFAAMLSLVFMGLLALSVDVGSMLYERRQLQNGADASALALASGCASDDALCDPTHGDLALDDLLNDNAADETTQFDPDRAFAPDGACGRDAGALPACPSEDPDTAPGYDEIRECPPLPDWLLGDGAGIPYVETYTRTETDGGSTLLPRYFSRALTGEDGASIRACARAAWGSPGSYSGTVPFTFSVCEFQYYIAEYGGTYPPGPGSSGYGVGAGQTPWPSASQEKTIYLKAGSSSPEPRSCRYNEMNDFPGAFGFVTSDNCEAEIATGGWLDTDTGVSVPNDCKPLLPPMHNTVVSIPVFNCVQGGATAPTQPIEDLDCTDLGTGTHAWYHIAGWARFYISGIKAPSIDYPSAVSGAACGSSEVCLKGWFVQGELDATSIDPDPDNDFGTYTVLPAG